MENNAAAFQAQLDALRAGSSFEINSPQELPGPIVIKDGLTIDGHGATIWSLRGPVVSVEADGVILRNLRIEVTGDGPAGDSDANCALRVKDDHQIILDNVQVRGTVKGLPLEEGDWQYPFSLSLGQLAHGLDHSFLIRVGVPVACQATSDIAGLDVQPRALVPGVNEIRLSVEALPRDTLIDGELWLVTAHLKRRISVTAHCSLEGANQIVNQLLYEAPKQDQSAVTEPTPVSATPAEPIAPPVPAAAPVVVDQILVRLKEQLRADINRGHFEEACGRAQAAREHDGADPEFTELWHEAERGQTNVLRLRGEIDRLYQRQRCLEAQDRLEELAGLRADDPVAAEFRPKLAAAIDQARDLAQRGGQLRAKDPAGALALYEQALRVCADCAAAETGAQSARIALQSRPVPPPPASSAPLPLVPADLIAVPTTTQVGLSWSSASGATGYKIRRSITKTGPWTIIANTATTNFVDVNVAQNTAYYYTVAAVNARGESLGSVPVHAVLLVPKNWATVVAAILVVILGVTCGFLLWRKSRPATARLSAPAVAAPATPPAPPPVPVRVPAPVVAKAPAALAKPGDLTAIAGNARVLVSWTPSTGASVYELKRATASQGPWTIIANLVTNSFNDTTVANGTVYFYVVEAFNEAGQRALSAPATATPAPPRAVSIFDLIQDDETVNLQQPVSLAGQLFTKHPDRQSIELTQGQRQIEVFCRDLPATQWQRLAGAPTGQSIYVEGLPMKDDSNNWQIRATKAELK
jgi:hypothetical protein